MTIRAKPTTLALLMVVVCVIAVALMIYWRYSRSDSVRELLERLPVDNATVVYVDFKTLRSSGLLDILAGSGADEEDDYRSFVRETGFDYRQDLDTALVSFHVTERFMLLRGRFEWGRIDRYVSASNGRCVNSFCQVRGSTPGRIISFFPITYGSVAMATSADMWAATSMMTRTNPVDPAAVPDEPLWVSLAGSDLAQAKWLPDGTRSFATALSSADVVVLAVAPKDQGFEVRLRADCESPQEAIRLASEFERVTELLRSLIRREHQTPSDTDLSGILISGAFDTVGAQLVGRWPVSPEFVSSLAEE